MRLLKRETLAALLVASGLAFGGLSGILYFYGYSESKTDYFSQLGGDFRLEGIDGTISTSDFRGQWLLIYFGFTRCPDVCPITLGLLSSEIKKLPNEKQNHVHVLFVSLDHRGDTPEQAHKYARHFGQNFTGVTGTKQALDRAVRLFGGSYFIEDMPKSEMKYSITHSDRIYIVDPTGQLKAAPLIHGDVSELSKQLKEYL